MAQIKNAIEGGRRNLPRPFSFYCVTGSGIQHPGVE
jgi:hypothetical protein